MHQGGMLWINTGMYVYPYIQGVLYVHIFLIHQIYLKKNAWMLSSFIFYCESSVYIESFRTTIPLN